MSDLLLVPNSKSSHILHHTPCITHPDHVTSFMNAPCLIFQAYDDLFHGGGDEESLEDLLEDDFNPDMRQRRRMSSGNFSFFSFFLSFYYGILLLGNTISME